MNDVFNIEAKTMMLDVLKRRLTHLVSDNLMMEVDVKSEWLAQETATAFTVQWQLPGKVLAHDKVVAEYPATLWDHIKAKLGMKYRVKTVRLNEVLAFPTIPIPPGHPPRVSIHWYENEGIHP